MHSVTPLSVPDPARAPLERPAAAFVTTFPRVEPTEPCLPGFEDIVYRSVPAEAINDYYAIRPDAVTLDLIRQRFAQLCGRRGSHDSPLKLENIHLSLHGFGPHLGCSKFLHDSAMAAAATIMTAPFAVTFDYAMSFEARRFKQPFVLRGRDGLPDLMSFQKSLGVAMRNRGLRRFVASSFTPHITLLYSPQMRPEHSVEPIRWIVQEFVLIRSFLKQSRQIELGRWPLRG